jgi:hypothetical protein
MEDTHMELIVSGKPPPHEKGGIAAENDGGSRSAFKYHTAKFFS